MQDSNGYLKRILSKFSLTIGLLAAFLLFNTPHAQASSLKVITSITYTLNEDGDVEGYVVYTFQSSQSQVVRYYTTTIPFLDAQDVSAQRDGKVLDLSTHQQDYGTDIVLDLNEMALQDGDSKSFTLKYTVQDYTSSSPAYLSLPMKINNTETAFAKVSIPATFGDLALKEADNITLADGPDKKEIKVSSPKESSLKLIFGNAVSYAFTIDKEISNSDNSPIAVELNLPPSTETQIVTYANIKPQPLSAYMDSEGNLFAVYAVAPKTTLNILIDGYITLGRERDTSQGIDRPVLTTTNKYWSLTPEYLESFKTDVIPELTTPLEGSSFPQLSTLQRQYLYDQVYKYMTTNYSFNDGDDASARKGAKSSTLSSSLSAYDFADLTIALLRENSVPSRLIIGYVTPIAGYFEEGFFHYWVEYWDSEIGWITMDPALSAKTGAKYHGGELPGHVTIVRRGQDPVAPKLSAYLPGEVIFNLSKTQSIESASLSIELVDNKPTIFSPFIGLTVSVSNNGNVPIYSLQGNFTGESIDVLPTGQIILPGQSSQFDVKLDTDSTILETAQFVAVVGEDTITDSSSTKIALSSPWWWSPLLATISLTMFYLTVSVVYSLIKAIRHRLSSR